jgi:hypothetical protein
MVSLTILYRLRANIAKFRGWLDDLLKTSWDACQGTDVLIESPSAMAGYHIAEALRIPYFRAFTMTWTRTRCVLTIRGPLQLFINIRLKGHTHMPSRCQKER